MSIEPCTKQDFEEGLRQDESPQPETPYRGAAKALSNTEYQSVRQMLDIYCGVEARMTALINTSASDCAITMDNRAERDPVDTIGEVTQLLVMMNHKGIEKKSHRQAMLRAARKALNSIGELPQ